MTYEGIDTNTNAATACGSDQVLEGGGGCVENYEAGNDGDSNSGNEIQGLNSVLNQDHTARGSNAVFNKIYADTNSQQHGDPVVSVAVGDADTGLNSDTDGRLEFWNDNDERCWMTWGEFNCYSPKNWVHKLNKTHEAYYSAQESPEVRAVIEGTASIENGTRIVELPQHFSKTVSDTRPSIKAQVTPNSINTYGLAVTNKSDDQIEVRELMNGSHTLKFDYRVTGIREGYEDKQVVRKTNSTAQPGNTTAAAS